ncbi:hypothetical protein KIPE111705_01105 [Kibdelosporangium persicum]|uniref:hypothetical protein n=1 Tax=Kibdelosporangium persicum TaxID=2698649 RepID=UPI0015660696|nr:hypothetical protein [Kibdelosporangium persicum]
MPTPRYSQADSQSDSNAARLGRARETQAHNELLQQARALRRVDDHAIDSQDHAMLTEMLGLSGSRTADTRSRYVGPLN